MYTIIKKLFVLSLLLLIPASANAVVRTWGAGSGPYDSSWSNRFNWTGDSIPGSADDAVFDNSVSTANCNVDMLVYVNSITSNTGYTGIFTQSQNVVVYANFALSGGTWNMGTKSLQVNQNFTLTCTFACTGTGGLITVSGDWYSAGGTFTPGTGSTLKFAKNGAQNITAGGQSFRNVIVGESAVQASTLTLQDKIKINGYLNIAYGNVICNNNNIELGGNLSVEPNGAFTKGTGSTLFIEGANQSLTDSTSATQDFGNIQIINSASLTVTAKLKANNLYAGAGCTLALSNQNTQVTGNFYIDPSASFSHGNGTVIFNGSKSQSLTTGGENFFKIKIDAGSSLLLQDSLSLISEFEIINGIFFSGLNNNLNIAGDLKIQLMGAYSSGTGSTLTFNGINQTIWDYTAVQNFGDVAISSNTTVTSAANFRFGQMKISAGATMKSTAGSTLTVTAGSTINVQNGGTFVLTGTEAAPVFLVSSVPGTPFTLVPGGFADFDFVSIKDCHVSTSLQVTNCTDISGNSNFVFLYELTWDGGGDGTTWNVANNWSPNLAPGGPNYRVTIDFPGAQVVATTPVTVGELTVGGTNTCYLTLGGSFTISSSSAFSGNLTLLSGSSLSAASNDINISGDWNCSTGGAGMGNNTVTFNGSKAQNILTASSFYNLVINNAGSTNTVTLQNILNVTRNLTITNGTLVANNKDINVTGDLNVQAAGKFTKGTGNLTFNGTGQQKWVDNSTGQDFGTVRLSASSNAGTTTSLKFDSFTIPSGTSFSCTTPGRSFIVSRTGGVTISAGGTMRLTGLEASLINIVSDLPGNAFSLSPQGTVDWRFVQIIDCNSTTPLTVFNCTDGTGNTNVIFLFDSTWNGSVSSAWNIASNWSPNIVPANSRFKVRIDLAGANVTAAGSVTVGELVIGGSAGCSLTASSSVTVSQSNGLSGNLTINNDCALSASGQTVYLAGNLDLKSSARLNMNAITFNGISQTWNDSTSGTNKVVFDNVLIQSGKTSILSSLKLGNTAINSGATLSCNQADAVISTAVDKQITVNGMLDLSGPALGQEIVLNSQSTDYRFYLNRTGSVSLSRVKIQDCNANGQTIDATNNCINLGNNVNVTFGPVYWTGNAFPDTNWTTGSNWSSNMVPRSEDTVVFNSTGTNRSCYVNNNINIRTLNISTGYTGSFTFKSGATATLSGDLSVTSGAMDLSGAFLICGGNWTTNSANFSAGTGQVFFDGSSGIQDITSGGVTFNKLTFNGGATFRLLGPLSVNGDLVISSGVLNLNSQSIVCNGNWLSNTGKFITGIQTTTLGASGGSVLITSNGCSFSSLVINNSATFQATDSMDINGNLSVNNGTFDLSTYNAGLNIAGNLSIQASGILSQGTGNIVFDGTTQQFTDSRGINFGNIIIAGSSSVTVNSSLSFYSLNIQSGGQFSSGAGTFSFTASVSGGITVNTGATLNLPGTAVQQISLKSNLTGTQFTLAGSGQPVWAYVRVQDCKATGGIIDATNNCVNLGNNTGIVFSPVRWDGGGADEKWTTLLNWNTDALPDYGDFIEFISGSKNCVVDTNITTGRLTINGYNGTVSITSGRTLVINGNLAISTGKLEIQNGVLLVTGNITVSAGATLSTVSGQIICSGNFSCPGIFSRGTGTVTFNGTGDQTFTAGSNTFYSILLSGTSRVYLQDSISLNSLTVSGGTEFKLLQPGAQISVGTGGIYVSGTFSLNGNSSNYVKLRSASPGQRFILKIDGTAAWSWVDVMDCDAGSGKIVNAMDNCRDSGNNLNVYFALMLVSASEGGEIAYLLDAKTKILVPPCALTEDTKIGITHITSIQSSETDFTVEAVSASSGKAIDKFNCRVTVTIHYDSTISGQVAAFWYNGIEWIKINGIVNAQDHTLTFETTRTGKYSIRNASLATEFTLDVIRPSKIFTPNNDGINDDITFYFQNPKNSVISQSKIYSILGAEIADMKLGEFGDTLSWDGRDHGGKIVPGGVYIYQIDVEKKVFNGTIVVAK